MLTQVYFNWDGTLEEFDKVKKLVIKLVNKRETINLFGLYIPSNEWNYCVLYEVESLDVFLMYQREVRALLKTENLDKISARKLELLTSEKELYK